MKNETGNSHWIKQLVKSGGILPNDPPFEDHPYKQLVPLNNFKKYIIGTFPPISYILDNPLIVNAYIGHLQQPYNSKSKGRRINKPTVPFYHGNRGSLWNYLLSDESDESEYHDVLNQIQISREKRRDLLIKFLNTSEINYADIIDKAKRKLNIKGHFDGSDNNIVEYSFNIDLINHILYNPIVETIIFNSASIFGANGVCHNSSGQIITKGNIKAFDLFVEACQKHDIDLYYFIPSNNSSLEISWQRLNDLSQDQKKNKIIFKIKLNRKSTIKDPMHFSEGEKIITIISGPSPSGANVRGGLKGNAIFEKWRKKFNNVDNSYGDFIKYIYRCFRNNSFTELYELNA